MTTPTSHRHWQMGVRALLAVLVLTIGLRPAAAALTAAGTPISNAAVARYEDDRGFPLTAVSNAVIVRVAPVYGIDILPDGTRAQPGQEVTAVASQTVVLPYSLRNTGNVPDTYRLEPANLGGDDGDLQAPRLFVDSNRNGRLDAVDSPYDNLAPPTLAPGTTLALLLVGTLTGPGPGPFDGEVFVDIPTAVSNGDPRQQDPDNVSRIRATGDASLHLSKQASAFRVTPGQPLTYTLSFDNRGPLPALAVDGFELDLDNDGSLDRGVEGILVADALPEGVQFAAFGDIAPVAGLPVVSVDGQGWWRSPGPGVGRPATPEQARHVGLFLPDDAPEDNFAGPVLLPSQQGFVRIETVLVTDALPGVLSNTGRALYGTTTGTAEAPSNPVELTVLPVVRVVVDDTDDNGAVTGSGLPDDPDDLTVVTHSSNGSWVEFQNETCNLGNQLDTVNLALDTPASGMLPAGLGVLFYHPDGYPLADNDGDGRVDTGPLAPGGCAAFVTRLFIPDGLRSDQPLLLAVTGRSGLDPDRRDTTFNRVDTVEGVQVRIEVKVRAETAGPGGTWYRQVPLTDTRIVVYGYDAGGSLVDQSVFWTDADGFVRFDDQGREVPLYNHLQDDLTYRVLLPGQFEGFNYYLTPAFMRSDFARVVNPGDTFSRGEVRVTVAADGTKLLITPLDPAGYVFDAVSGARIDGACVNFYRCDTAACDSYQLVDIANSPFVGAVPPLLDLYPDGVSTQDNVQVSGPGDTVGNDVGKAPGAFEFRFRDYRAAYDGWYFIATTFDCTEPAADPSLADRYAPVALQADRIWNPLAGTTYRGEPFFVDIDFPGAILLRVPLLPADFAALRITKTIDDDTVGIGDLVGFTLTVENPNSGFTVFDAIARDLLPHELRYATGSTRIDGRPAVDATIAPDGRQLSWSLGDLAPGQRVEIRFYTRVAAGATEGRKVNRALAQGWSDSFRSVAIVSDSASAAFQLTKGVFTDRAYIIGRVFVDDNHNRIADANEAGLPGIKIYMQDGRYVVTDGQGMYHFDNLRPGTHVLKIDPASLPDNTRLAVVDNRNVGDPGSTFVDLMPGDLFKANFRVKPQRAVVGGRLTAERIRGQLAIERTLSGFQLDPDNGRISLRHRLQITNRSPAPLYELRYREQSVYQPLVGSVYLDGAAFRDPSPTQSGAPFEWHLPLLEPGQSLLLEFDSNVAAAGPSPSAELCAEIQPGEAPVRLPVHVSLVFGQPRDKVFTLTVLFDSGSAVLSPAAQASLQTAVDLIRQRPYEWVLLAVAGHTDAVPVNPARGDVTDNRDLSAQRAAAAGTWLQEHLLDMQRVRLITIAPTDPAGRIAHLGDGQTEVVTRSSGLGATQPADDASGASRQNRRVSVTLHAIGKTVADRTVALGDVMSQGLYQFEARIQPNYPAAALGDAQVLIALPADLVPVNGSARVNGQRLKHRRQGIFFSLPADPPAGEDELVVELRLLARGSQPLGELPVILAARTPNGKRLFFTAADTPDDLVAAAGQVYAPAPEPAPLGFLFPASDVVQSARVCDLRVAVPLDLPWRLLLNGDPVPERQVAEIARDRQQAAATYLFKALKLAAGDNRLVLEIDGRAPLERRIRITGQVADLALHAQPADPPADGRTPAYVVVNLLDAGGQRVAENAYVTVHADRGEIFDAEQDNFRPVVAGRGLRVRAHGGRAVVKLSPAAGSQTRRVTVGFGPLERELEVRFIPEKRSAWIVAGSLDGALGVSDRKNAPPEDEDMPFDHTRAEDLNAQGRAAVFAKGSVGDATVTLRYDTRETDRQNTLLEQNVPSGEQDRFYPVYGDESEQYFEAPSRERLYLKVERERSFAMFGDYRTDLGPDFEFNRYDRTVNGGLVHLEKENRFALRGFISQNDQSMVREQLAARGVSGPYYLHNNDLVEFSEQVRIETRDRFDPNRILTTRNMARFADYSIDYTEGWILFSQAVAGFDDALNPQVIQVLYETRNLEQKRYLYGGRAEKGFFDGRLTIGALVVTEEHSEQDKHLTGADLRFDDGRNWTVWGEITQSDNFETAGDISDTSGLAHRVEVQYRRGQAVSVNAYHKQVEAGFQNLSATTADSGYETTGAEARINLFEGRTRLTVDALTDDGATADRDTAEVRLDQRIGATVGATAGVRYNREDRATDAEQSTQVIAGLNYHPIPRLGLSLRREQSLSGETDSEVYPTRTIGRLDYQMTPRVAAYVTSEIQERADRDAALTTAGLDASIGENTTAYSKYTLEDAVSGWRNQSHIGIAHQFFERGNLSLDGGIESVETLAGADAGEDYTAPRVSFSYDPGDRYKLTGRGEVRFGSRRTDTLFTLGGSVKLTPAHTLLARGRYFDADTDETDVLVGLAFRPRVHDRLNTLTKLRWKQRNLDQEESVWIGSLHVNYQPWRPLRLMGEYALKYVEVAQVDTAFTDLLRGRLLLDVGDRLDVGLHAGWLRQHDSNTAELAWGPEAGLRVFDNCWVSLGYNFSGFSDDDFDQAAYWARGPYLKLRIKFDENSLARLARAVKRPRAAGKEKQ